MRQFSKPQVRSATRLALAAGLAILSGCSPAHAQTDWQCNAPNGRYVKNHVPLSPGVHTLSGRIQFDRSEFGEQWQPVAHLAFIDSTISQFPDCFCNGIRAEVNPEEPDVVKFFMTYNGESEGIAQAEVGIPITFRLSIDDQGVLTAVIGKTNPVTKSAQLVMPRHNTLHMSCSSGEVSFINVREG